MRGNMLDLPNELLDQIFWYCEQFDTDRLGESRYATFACLSRVCQQLHSIVAPYLYAKQDFKRKADIVRFLSAVEEHPSLAPLVHELRVEAPTWLLSRHHINEDKETRHALGLFRHVRRPLAPVLHLFTNLQSFHLEYATEVAELLELLPKGDAIELFPVLEHVRIADREAGFWDVWDSCDGRPVPRVGAFTLNTAHILPFWSAPRLRSLTLYFLRIHGPRTPTANVRPKLPALNRMKLMRCRFETGAWQELLALRSTTSLDLCNVAWDEQELPSLEWMDLSPIRELYWSQRYWQGIFYYHHKKVVRPRVDLRVFPSLSTLRIDVNDLAYVEIEPGDHLFAPELDIGISETSEVVQPRLPQSLEYLRVDIPGSDRTKRMAALSGIASRCKTDTPRLKRLDLHSVYHHVDKIYKSSETEVEISTDAKIEEAIASLAYPKPSIDHPFYNRTLEHFLSMSQDRLSLRKLQGEFDAVGVKTRVWTQVTIPHRMEWNFVLHRF